MGYHIANRRIQNTRFAELVPVPYSEFIPAGSILPYMKAASQTEAPEGWYFLDGVSTFETATNPRLAELFPSGTLPDFGGKAIMAEGDGVTAGPGGSNSVTLAPANLPAHRHNVELADGGHFHTFMHSRVVGGLNPGGTYIEISVNEHGPPDTPHDGQVISKGTGAYVHSTDGVVSQTGTGATLGNPPAAHLQSVPVNTAPAHYGVSCYIIKGG